MKLSTRQCTNTLIPQTHTKEMPLKQQHALCEDWIFKQLFLSFSLSLSFFLYLFRSSGLMMCVSLCALRGDATHFSSGLWLCCIHHHHKNKNWWFCWIAKCTACVYLEWAAAAAAGRWTAGDDATASATGGRWLALDVHGMLQLWNVRQWVHTFTVLHVRFD